MHVHRAKRGNLVVNIDYIKKKLSNSILFREIIEITSASFTSVDRRIYCTNIMQQVAYFSTLFAFHFSFFDYCLQIKPFENQGVETKFFKKNLLKIIFDLFSKLKFILEK